LQLPAGHPSPSVTATEAPPAAGAPGCAAGAGAAG